MTYDTFLDARALGGMPGIAVRLGRALEEWGRRAARPVDRETLQLEYARQRDVRDRALAADAARLRW